MGTVSGVRESGSAYVAEVGKPPCAIHMRSTERNKGVNRPQFSRHYYHQCWPKYQASVNNPLIHNQFIPKNLAPFWNPTSEKYHHWVEPHVNVNSISFFNLPSLNSYDIDFLSNDNIQRIQRRFEMAISKQSMHRDIQSLKKLSRYSSNSHSSYFEAIYNFNVRAEQTEKRLNELWIHNDL